MRDVEDDGLAFAAGTRRDGKHHLALVASSNVNYIGLRHILLGELERLTNARVLLRSPRNGSPGRFEEMAAMFAGIIGVEVVWCTPAGEGRGATFLRDYRMVEQSDRVIAFFSPDQVMAGGTGHVVEAALNREIPVWAWEVTENGLQRVGEDEGSTHYTGVTEQMS